MKKRKKDIWIAAVIILIFASFVPVVAPVLFWLILIVIVCFFMLPSLHNPEKYEIEDSDIKKDLEEDKTE